MELDLPEHRNHAGRRANTVATDSQFAAEAVAADDQFVDDVINAVAAYDLAIEKAKFDYAHKIQKAEEASILRNPLRNPL